MNKSHHIPEKVALDFNYKKELSQLENRVYRILWASISIGHIRDQYFKKNVEIATIMINKRQPKEFKDFLKIIYAADLHCFGKKFLGRRDRPSWRYGYTPLNKRWWRHIWNLINYGGDIKLEISKRK